MNCSRGTNNPCLDFSDAALPIQAKPKSWRKRLFLQYFAGPGATNREHYFEPIFMQSATGSCAHTAEKQHFGLLFWEQRLSFASLHCGMPRMRSFCCAKRWGNWNGWIGKFCCYVNLNS